MPHAMAGNLYKAAFSIRFTSVSPEIETLLQDLTATTALAEEPQRPWALLPPGFRPSSPPPLGPFP